MIENVISKRYAKALSSSISDEGILKRALESLKVFGDAIEADRQLERFFRIQVFLRPRKLAWLASYVTDCKSRQLFAIW